MIKNALLAALLLSLTANAQISVTRIKRQLETSKPQEIQLDLRRGETVAFDLQFLSYGTVMELSGSTVTLHATTNGMQAGTSFQISGTAGSNGTASVRISVDEWLPYQLTSGTWTLECANPSASRIMRASGAVKLSGLYYPSTNSPLPVTWATNFWTAISAIQSKTNAWNASYAWGDHAAAGYLSASTWLTWLSTNTYVKVESDPTVPSYVKAITQDQITSWSAPRDGTVLASIDSNHFVRITATNLVMYEVVTTYGERDVSKMKVVVGEDLYGDPNIWPGNPILVNRGTYIIPANPEQWSYYEFNFTTNSSSGITWSAYGIGESANDCYFSNPMGFWNFNKNYEQAGFPLYLNLLDAGFYNYEYETSLSLDIVLLETVSTNAIKTFAAVGDAAGLSAPQVTNIVRTVVHSNQVWSAAGTNATYQMSWDATNGTWIVQEILP